MLDIVINITHDIAAGLNTRIKLFVEKGLKGLYPKGKNVERLLLDYGSIRHSIDQKGSLPEYPVTNLLKGLSMASHEDLAKFLMDFEITLKNSLLNVKMEGTVMDQIVEVMDTALTQYTSYSFKSQWMASSTHHANNMFTPTTGFKCDNCGDLHFMNQ